jgi:hypothetical protein
VRCKWEASVLSGRRLFFIAPFAELGLLLKQFLPLSKGQHERLKADLIS